MQHCCILNIKTTVNRFVCLASYENDGLKKRECFIWMNRIAQTF